MNLFKNKTLPKKRTLLQGDIIFPLIAGQRATILHNNQRILTSTVAAILEVSEKNIVIETLNTIYCIMPDSSEEFVSSEFLPEAKASV